MSISELQRFVGMMSGNDARIVGPSMIEAHKTVAATLEKIAITLDTVNRAVGDRSANPHGRKPLAESRCINSLETLGSNKLEFKNWNEKFINATAQTFGTPWRTFMKNLNRKLDQDSKVLDELDLDLLEGANELEDIKRISEDIYYVLVEKTEGDAGLRANSGEMGEGLNAYMRLYL